MNMTLILSKRLEIRRKPLIRQNGRSISLRRRYQACLVTHVATRSGCGGKIGIRPRYKASCLVLLPSFSVYTMRRQCLYWFLRVHISCLAMRQGECDGTPIIRGNLRVLVVHPPRNRQLDCAPFVQRADAVGMHFDDRAVQTDGPNTNAGQLLMLQFLEQPIQTGADGMPVIEALGQRPLFATFLREVQDRVEDIEGTEQNVAALYRQERLDTSEILCGDFKARGISYIVYGPLPG